MMKTHFLQVKDRGKWVYVTGYDEHGQLFVTKSKEIAADAQLLFNRYCVKAIFIMQYPDKTFRYEP